MLKTLLRKNMQEVGSAFFRDKKGGVKRGGAVVGLIILYVICYLALALSFGAMAALFFSTVPAGEEWIAWSIMGIMGVAMAALINAITSYAQLFLAHDNEILLAMPIKPGTLVISRMVSVYIMGLIYSSMVWLPTMFVAGVTHHMTALSCISQILMLIVQGFLILALTCLLGWVVAFFATKFKNQKIVTVIVCLLFLVMIYVLQFKTNTLLNKLADNISGAGAVIKQSLFPFYLLGKAACGDIVGIIVFTAITAVVLGLAYLLISKTFFKMSTAKSNGSTAKFKETQVRATSASKALLRKEATQFVNSVTCMLNAGLGVIIMVAGSIFLFVKGDLLADKIAPAMAIPGLAQLLPLIVLIMICIMESLGTISAASVSLEGKNIWMLQSMPVDPLAVLNAKIQFAVYLEAIPGLLLAVSMCLALGLDEKDTVMLAIFAAFFGRVSATFGTFLNLRHPNLEWTSEQTPVKQGAAVAILLFGGWVFGLVIGAIGYLTRNLMPAYMFILAMIAMLYIVSIYLNKWIKTKGVAIFRYL